MRDPVTEFKKEGYQMFENFLNEFKYGSLQALFNVELMPEEQPQAEVVQEEKPPEERKPKAPKPRKLKDRLKERQNKKPQ